MDRPHAERLCERFARASGPLVTLDARVRAEEPRRRGERIGYRLEWVERTEPRSSGGEALEYGSVEQAGQMKHHLFRADGLLRE